MKAALVLKTSTQLSMTPQLQQAIRLLQMSSLDLQEEVQEALDSNAMLESYDDENELSPSSAEKISTDNSTESSKAEVNDLDAIEPISSTDSIPNELEIDTNWEDIYQTSASNLPAADDEWDFTATTASATSLSDHLLDQLNLLSLAPEQMYIALSLIDNINNEGYLQDELSVITKALKKDLPSIIEKEVLAVLSLIQQFEPTGIAARNLSECLLLQLQQLPKNTLWLAEAKKLCADYLNYLGSKDVTPLLRRMQISQDDLSQIVKLIQTLDPKPGLTIEETEPEYITPDVLVFKKNERWQVELNPETIPRIRVNNQYASWVERGNSSDDQNFMRQQLQDARWLIKSIQSRGETLLKVASKILEYQYDFFEYGPAHMKPLVLAEVADAIEMHESTISRATTNKYMHTPRGIFELKYFFSSHVNTAEGGECSSTAIRAMIAKLVDEEDPRKPLSDSKITHLLEAEGIQVARRTVAKYRESLNIASSSDRKKRF